MKQISAGQATKDVARELGVTDHALYNWKSKYSGLGVSVA